MSAVICANASVAIGTGHIMRTLTLAEALASRGVPVTFLSRGFPGSLGSLVEQRGFSMITLPLSAGWRDSGQDDDVRWFGRARGDDALEALAALKTFKRPIALVTDNYGIDAEWHRVVRPAVERIMSIEDFSHNPLDCDIVLDQAIDPEIGTYYRGRIPPHAQCFFGARYALLRAEFLAQRRRVTVRDGSVRKILVSFGGSDPTGETMKTLRALDASAVDADVEVVISEVNPVADEIAAWCAARGRLRCHRQTSRIAELMVTSDVAIGGIGFTTYERAYLGLPTLAIAQAANQIIPARAFEQRGILRDVGSEIDVASLRDEICAFIDDREARRTMSQAALDLMADHEDVRDGSLVRALLEPVVA